jgi:hypothetical protein
MPLELNVSMLVVREMPHVQFAPEIVDKSTCGVRLCESIPSATLNTGLSPWPALDVDCGRTCGRWDHSVSLLSSHSAGPVPAGESIDFQVSTDMLGAVESFLAGSGYLRF